MVENMVQMELFGGERPGKPGHRDNPAVPQIPPPLAVAPEPNMVRVAPGRHAWVPKDAATPPDAYVMCRWSKQEDGTYAPVPVAGRYVRLDSRTAALLGFPARAGEDGNERCRYDTILRLGRAGFVDVVRVAPNTILLDLDSWYRHLADCSTSTAGTATSPTAWTIPTAGTRAARTARRTFRQTASAAGSGSCDFVVY